MRRDARRREDPHHRDPRLRVRTWLREGAGGRSTIKGHAGESLLRLCAVGIAAWIVVLLLFVVAHVELPEWTEEAVFHLIMPWGLLFAVPMFLLLAAGIGIVAIGKARSRGAKWIVALVHFSPPLGYAAWWLTA